MCDPAARETKNGSPPTLLKARTGELTPPGMNLLASANKEELVIPEAKRAASLGKFDHLHAAGLALPRGPSDRTPLNMVDLGLRPRLSYHAPLAMQI